MKVAVIGDIHGRPEWKKIADLDILRQVPNLVTEYDRYIFLGDYVDSFNITGDKILDNLKEIIQLKKNYPEQVVLLLGNHDLQYWFNYEFHGCSGYNPERNLDYQQVFRENKELFEIGYQINNYIFTHAGISNKWYEKFLEYSDLNLGTLFNIDLLNKSFKNYKLGEHNPLFDVGRRRGGWNPVGGIFWADFRETCTDYLNGFNQVVGHTRIKKITKMPDTVNFPTTIFPKGSITYVDVLENIYEQGSDEKCFLELEIN